MAVLFFAAAVLLVDAEDDVFWALQPLAPPLAGPAGPASVIDLIGRETLKARIPNDFGNFLIYAA